MTLRCTIIDDEPLATELLASYVEKTPFLTLAGKFGSAVEAISSINDKNTDIVFLDIQMPELSGIEFARLIPHEVKIIFTTAFSQYAIEGYKVNAIDYLLKPVSYEDFLSATSRIMNKYEDKTKQTDEVKLSDRFFFVRSEYKLVQIKLDDILYIECLKDYVRIFLEGESKPVMSLINMKKIEAALPYPEFIRIHRSYIVHMPKIKTIDRSRVLFGDTYIPVSESYKDSFTKHLDSYCI